VSTRATEVAAVAALATALTIVAAAPVLRAPSQRLFGMETVGRHHDPFTVMEQFGRPHVLGVYSQPLTDMPGAWLARAGGAVAAYNGLVLVTFPLSAAAAYLLARHLALSPPAAALAGIAFAFSPFHLAQAAYHPHIAQTQWVPLFLLALWRCLDRSTPAAVAFLALSVVGVTLSNFYGGLIAAVLAPLAAAAYWVVAVRGRPRAGVHLAVTAATLVVLAGAGLAYAWYAAPGLFTSGADFAFVREDLFLHSAKWWSYLVPPLAHPLLGGFARRVWDGAGVREGRLEQQVSLGGAIVALGLVAVLAWMRRDRLSPATAMVPVVSAVAFAALLCSLSPERTIGSFTFVRPSALLYPVVPMFRAYARFGVAVQLMAALLAGIGAERLWRSGARAARIACLLLVAVAAGEYAVRPSATWRDVLPTAADRWVADQPPRVRALDCTPLTAESESVRWLSGYRIALLGGAFDDCREPHFVDKLAAAGYTHLVVRRGTPEARWFARPGASEGLPVVAAFADSEVRAVRERPPLVYTAEMTAFYPREGDGDWTWRWMGPEASWKVVNRSDRSVVAALDVEITAFHGARRLKLLLDGGEVQTLVVAEPRRTSRIGPLALPPGRHLLAFAPADPPTVAADLLGNGDRRPLSVRFGTWRWAVQG
jgi:hypothetical protein